MVLYRRTNRRQIEKRGVILLAIKLVDDCDDDRAVSGAVVARSEKRRLRRARLGSSPVLKEDEAV